MRKPNKLVTNYPLTPEQSEAICALLELDPVLTERIVLTYNNIEVTSVDQSESL